MQRVSGGRDAISVLSAQVLLLLASLASQSILAWALLPAGRGVYALFVALSTILPVVFMLGLDRSIQFYLMSGKIGLTQALRALLMVWAGSVACSVLVGLSIGGNTGLPAPTQEPVQWLAGISVIATASLYSMLIRMRVAVRQYGGYLASTVVQGVVNLSLLSILWKVEVLGAATAVAALAFSYGVASLVSLRALGNARLECKHGQNVGELRRKIATYGIRFYPALVGHALDFNLGTIALGAVAANSDVGIFAALAALMLRLLLLAQAFQEAMLPRISADEGGRVHLVVQLARLASMTTLAIGLLFALVSRPVLAVLLSPKFAEHFLLVWWMLPGVAVHAASTLLMPYFEGTERPVIVSIAVWCGLAVNLVVVLLGFPVMGLDSAGLAMSLGMFARFTLLVTAFTSVTGVSAAAFFGLRRADLELVRSLVVRARKGGI